MVEIMMVWITLALAFVYCLRQEACGARASAVIGISDSACMYLVRACELKKRMRPARRCR